jgi:hypothetical protein
VKGLWCDECLLPSAFTCDVVALYPTGVYVVGVFDGCRNNDEHVYE